MRLRTPLMTTEAFVARVADDTYAWSECGAVAADGVLPPGVDAHDPAVTATVERLRAARAVLAITRGRTTPPAGTTPLCVQVREDFTLDVGAVDDTDFATTGVRVVHPPAVPMIEQVLDYLDAQSDVPLGALPRCTRMGRAGAAAAAVCLRWGTYFALLADRNLPLWPIAVDPATRDVASRIGDEEMARINIEASAALAIWTDRALAASDGFDFDRLVEKALYYLPMPFRCVKRPLSSVLFGFASPTLHTQIAAVVDKLPDASCRLAASAAHPTRVFANTTINHAWRNGLIEDIHAGQHRGAPLDQRRITPIEERRLLSAAAEELAAAATIADLAIWDDRSWEETVQAFNLVGLVSVPRAWTLTGTSRVMRLHAHDPGPRDEAETADDAGEPTPGEAPDT